jgi:hypothetical protein
MPKIIIDSSSRILYASFYIKGLYQVFGKKNVTFSTKYFSDLKRENEDFAFEHYFAFVVINSEKKITKYIIDFCDPTDINTTAYNWCDYYAKINIDVIPNLNFKEKLISIPPSFGIRIWTKTETIYNCILNFIRLKGATIVSLERYLRDYYEQLMRPKIEDYYSVATKETQNRPYIFSIANLWQDSDSMLRTNIQRKKFMETCKAMNCDFEGGFYTPEYKEDFFEFKELLFYKHHSVKEYVSKTIQSKIVFNTPSVHKCHGWKLGEFMAMGKPMLSTPILNRVPVELIHGKHIHIAKTNEELNVGVKLLLSNNKYCNDLSENIKTYYNNYASPFAVLLNLK